MTSDLLCLFPGGASVGKPLSVVVLVSGGGTNLQALLDAISSHEDYPVRVVAVGADRGGIEGLARAERAGIPTFVVPMGDFADRSGWDVALMEAVASFEPELVVGAGFMKIVGPAFLARFGGRFINTHPALLPSFPGAHGVRDALAYGVCVAGATCHFVDAGVDTGAIIDQRVVAVADGDTEDSLHERIKVVEREMLVEVVRRLAVDGARVQGRRVLFGG
ncbi:phosphoribosylglycinamide formyltransferase [Dermatophilus congolensis]|uniref:Phosphoribosylglycinamide formyltransferase n=1 Tax=Dermatophilus congolensis TaxID=1863 RepID=A0A239VBT5_9MICO|nr:phosphoribosylglycinamide formyltransferase [Dermatophilus congolensis]SNV19612.1 Phosphoribosylglycinamide formyltransferase [Dermatophilus congolensis]